MAIRNFDRAAERLHEECSKKSYQRAGVRFRNDDTGQTFLYDTDMATTRLGIPPLSEWDVSRWQVFIRHGLEFYNTVSDFIMDRIYSIILFDENKKMEIIF